MKYVLGYIQKTDADDGQGIESLHTKYEATIVGKTCAVAVNHWRPQKLDYPRNMYKMQKTYSSQAVVGLTHTHLHGCGYKRGWYELSNVETEKRCKI